MNYKLTYLTADNEDKTPLKTIEEAGGKILKEEGLGQRKLAYKINKNQAAFYQVIYFSLDGENLAKLRGEIKSNTNIIRDLITKATLPIPEKMKAGEKNSSPVSSTPVKATEKIEKTVPEKKIAQPKQGIETKTVLPAPVATAKINPPAGGEKIATKPAKLISKPASPAGGPKEIDKKKIEEDKKRLEELDKKLEEILKI